METGHYSLGLINAIRNRPVIYDRSQKDPSKGHSHLQIAWEEVSEEVGFPVSKCKEKWKNLRDGFVKCRRKVRISDGTNGQIKEWKWFRHLTFLDGHTDNRHNSENEDSVGIVQNDDSISIVQVEYDTPATNGYSEWKNVDEDQEFSYFCGEENPLEDHPGPGNHLKQEQHSSDSEKSVPRKRRKRKTNTKAKPPLKMTKSDFEKLQDCNGGDETEENVKTIPIKGRLDGENAFGLSIASDLRNLPEADRAFAKFKIQEVIYKVINGQLKADSNNRQTHL